MTAYRYLIPVSWWIVLTWRGAANAFYLAQVAGDRFSFQLHDKQSKTLYDVLGASPKESPEGLRQKYTSLAKVMHPDSQGGGNQEKFNEIAMAWSVLGNARQRLQYDRELQAKEFTKSVETIVGTTFEKGFVPFMKQSVKSGKVAVQVSSEIATDFSEKWQDMSSRMELAREISKVEKRQRDLEQQASAELNRASRMEIERNNLESSRLDTLSQTSNAALSSKQTASILQGFGKSNPSLVQSLKTSEAQHTSNLKDVQVQTNKLRQAENKLNSAKLAEVTALEKLKQAEEQYNQAKSVVAQSQKELTQSQKQLSSAAASVQTSESALALQMKKTRTALHKMESDYLVEKEAQLTKSQKQLEESAKEMQRRSQTLAGELATLYQKQVEAES